MNFPENTASFLVLAFSISSIVRLYFYFPQIKSVLRSNKASAIHVPTWVVWTCHNTIAAAYGWLVTQDVPFALFSFASACCTSLIAMVASKKQRAYMASETDQSVSDGHPSNISL